MLAINGPDGVGEVPPLVPFISQLSPALFSGWRGPRGGDICSSRYSSTMASQTSLTTKLIVLWGTLHAYCMSLYLAPEYCMSLYLAPEYCMSLYLAPEYCMSLYLAPEYCMSLYLAPDARWRRVSATFKTGSRGVRQLVVCLVILGVSLSTISSNMAGGILIKFWNDLWSSFRSSTIKRSYRPCSTLRLIHGLTQTLLCLLLLLLRLRFRSCWSWTSWLLCCCKRNTSTSRLWGFIVISSGTHVQRCVLLGGLVQTGGGMKDRPIYISVTPYANRA